MQGEKPIEQIKRATAAAVKAIGHRAALEVAFAHGVAPGAMEPGGHHARIKLPEPSGSFTGEDRALLRGAADAEAVRLRYHDEKLHQTMAPVDVVACGLFHSLEQARCEALGARRMAGVRDNIGALLDVRARAKGLSVAISRRDALLAEVLRLVAHEKLGGGKIPCSAQKAVESWREVWGEQLESYWPRFEAALTDQKAFAEQALDVLAALELIPTNHQEQRKPKEKEAEKKEDNEEPPQAASEETQVAKGASEEQSEGDDKAAPAEALPDSEGEEQDKSRPNEARSASQDEAHGPVTTYRVFTNAFDEVVRANDLCSAEELQRLRYLLDHQMKVVQSAVIRLANKLQRRLLAQQRRRWDFDLEEGLLDAARLARVVANPLVPLSFKMEREVEFRDTVVTLLIDNSGSMRGRPITLAAMSADILTRTLERCGVKTEILGFTTRTWKGGKARELWAAAEKPARPGRLNDLRHIIYKDADVPWRRARNNIGLMLREGLLKENIDGEALLWAHERLMRRPEERRILMVVSDGAPVDDSTLAVNPANYLEQHLRSAIDWIERRSPVELVAIGIGHDVTRYYRRAVTISEAEQLGGTMTEQLAALFDRKKNTQ